MNALLGGNVLIVYGDRVHKIICSVFTEASSACSGSIDGIIPCEEQTCLPLRICRFRSQGMMPRTARAWTRTARSTPTHIQVLADQKRYIAVEFLKSGKMVQGQGRHSWKLTTREDDTRERSHAGRLVKLRLHNKFVAMRTGRMTSFPRVFARLCTLPAPVIKEKHRRGRSKNRIWFDSQQKIFETK